MTRIYDHNPPAPLARRRFSVGLAYGAWALTLILALLSLLFRGDWLAVLLSGAGMVTLLGCAMTAAAASGLPRWQDPNLDERQQARLTWAYALAHQFWLWALGAVLVFFVATDVLNLPLHLPGRVSAFGILIPTYIALRTLPTALLAWTEPDDPDA